MLIDAAGWAVFLPGQEIRCPCLLGFGAYCAHLVCAVSTAIVFVRSLEHAVPAPTHRIRLEMIRCMRHGRQRQGHMLVLEVDPSATVTTGVC